MLKILDIKGRPQWNFCTPQIRPTETMVTYAQKQYGQCSMRKEMIQGADYQALRVAHRTWNLVTLSQKTFYT